MRKHFSLLLSVTALSSLSFSGYGDTIFKCKNQQGGLLYQKTACKPDTETVTSWEPRLPKTPPPQPEAPKKTAEWVIKQQDNGSYHLDANVNGKSLNFIVDTGASMVSLPQSFAREAHISCQDKVDMMTANGASKACTATVKKITFGPFFIDNVSVVIAPNLTHPLMGMNVLQLFKIAQEKGEMRLSWREK